MLPFSTKKTNAGFSILPFGIDGIPVGKGFWEFEKLSSKWFQICMAHLRSQGPVFNTCWSQNLSHIRTKFTSASGAAIGTFFADNQIASSILLLSGLLPDAEREIMILFIESLRKVDIVKAISKEARPFESIKESKDRPMMVFVPWPNKEVSDRDHSLVSELGIHLAGAFFSESQGVR